MQEISRTPPGVRELKPRYRAEEPRGWCRTPPGVRELKHDLETIELTEDTRRTPPRVRELKPPTLIWLLQDSITSYPSQVRELKLYQHTHNLRHCHVAPGGA